ncbi:hypothetical protein CRG98_039948 [Punica granatum]|uniref:Uncharacterized protein n=1 Tax=Punica granatum TaxID=22663 RepID=A0A2I0I779_PUNGR|nr:hypothetical protein CRG98_039948 [Punica granatum]
MLSCQLCLRKVPSWTVEWYWIADGVCATEFNLAGARMREAYATRLESVHLPGDARRTRVLSCQLCLRKVPSWTVEWYWIADGVCATEFNLARARMREAYATRLESVHLPGDARRTRVRRSRHLLFMTCRLRAVESPGSRGMGNEDARHRIYNREIETPKVDGMGRTNETRARTGRPFSSIDRGVFDSLMPRISVNHGMTIMPLSGRTNDSEATKETILDPGGVKEHSTIFRRTRPRGLLDSPWIVGGLLCRFEPFLACITRQARQ